MRRTDLDNAGYVFPATLDAGTFPTQGIVSVLWDANAIYFSARVHDP